MTTTKAPWQGKIVASNGEIGMYTETIDGCTRKWKSHTFTSSSNFYVDSASSAAQFQVFAVGGGGSGGGCYSPNQFRNDKPFHYCGHGGRGGGNAGAARVCTNDTSIAIGNNHITAGTPGSDSGTAGCGAAGAASGPCHGGYYNQCGGMNGERVAGGTTHG